MAEYRDLSPFFREARIAPETLAFQIDVAKYHARTLVVALGYPLIRWLSRRSRRELALIFAAVLAFIAWATLTQPMETRRTHEVIPPLIESIPCVEILGCTP